MVKIAFLGDRESVKGFACVGVNVFPCETAEAAETTPKKLTHRQHGLLHITEEYALALSEPTEKFDERPSPAIIPLPGVKNNNGIGITRLKASVEKAVGSDIIFNK